MTTIICIETSDPFPVIRTMEEHSVHLLAMSCGVSPEITFRMYYYLEVHTAEYRKFGDYLEFFYTGAGILIGRMNISCYTLFVWLCTDHTRTYNYNSQGGTLFEA